MSPSTRSCSSVSMASSSLRRDAVAGGDEHAVARAGRLLVDAVDHVGEERVVEVGGEDAEDARPALYEAAGHGVGPVAERGRGRLHRGPPLRADVPRVRA